MSQRRKILGVIALLISLLVLVIVIVIAILISRPGLNNLALTDNSKYTAPSSPGKSIAQYEDTLRVEDVQSITSAINLYFSDNKSLPTYGTLETQLPLVTTTNIMSKGIDASEINGVAPTYLTSIPTDSDGKEYKVGVNKDGEIVVGIELSDGTVITNL